jgi:hypothetical protein
VRDDWIFKFRSRLLPVSETNLELGLSTVSTEFELSDYSYICDLVWKSFEPVPFRR